MQTYPVNPTFRIESGGFAVLNWEWRDRGVLIESSKLFYITDGEIVIRIDGEEVLCGAGDMVLIPSGVRHDYYLREIGNTSKYWFHFSVMSNGVSVFENFDMPIRFSVKETDRYKITELFSRAVLLTDDYPSYLQRIGAICELTSYYLKYSGAKEKHGTHDVIDEILNYIGEHLSENITLAGLASRACLSPNYFVRRFGTRTGMAPLKYVAYARMEMARQLLSATSLGIAEIMTSVGFSDSAHFSKAFKRHTGYSPTLYRRVSSKTQSE